MRPEQCRGNVFSIAANTFTLRDNKTIIAGVLPSGAKLAVADATQWNSPAALLASAAAPADCPWSSDKLRLQSGQPVYLALQQLSRDGQEELPVYRDVSKNNAANRRRANPSRFTRRPICRKFSPPPRNIAAPLRSAWSSRRPTRSSMPPPPR